MLLSTLTTAYLHISVLQYVRVSALKSQKEEDEDIRNVWNLMKDCWKMPPPRLIVSVTGGAQNFFMKRRLLTGFKRGLMKVATTAGISNLKT
jgi:hypothetical protein